MKKWNLLQDFKFKYGIFGSVSACTIAMFKSSNHLSFSSSLVAAIIKDLDESLDICQGIKVSKKWVCNEYEQKKQLFAVND